MCVHRERVLGAPPGTCIMSVYRKPVDTEVFSFLVVSSENFDPHTLAYKTVWVEHLEEVASHIL